MKVEKAWHNKKKKDREREKEYAKRVKSQERVKKAKKETKVNKLIKEPDSLYTSYMNLLQVPYKQVRKERFRAKYYKTKVGTEICPMETKEGMKPYYKQKGKCKS